MSHSLTAAPLVVACSQPESSRPYQDGTFGSGGSGLRTPAEELGCSYGDQCFMESWKRPQGNEPLPVNPSLLHLSCGSAGPGIVFNKERGRCTTARHRRHTRAPALRETLIKPPKIDAPQGRNQGGGRSGSELGSEPGSGGDQGRGDRGTAEPG